MLRRGATILTLALIVASASSANAGWWANFKRDYHRNAQWPEPFFWQDRQAVMAPFAVQVANGWRRQNLLSDYHFDEATQQLTLAGETKLRYILTQMPPGRRVIFVQQGLAADVTASRMVSVQRASARMLPPDRVAEIQQSNLPNDGWPADDSDAVTRAWNSSRPEPRLKPGGIENGGGDSTSIK